MAAFATFTDLGGGTVALNPNLVETLTPVPVSLLPVGVLAGTYIDGSASQSPVRLAVQGDIPATIATLLAAAPGITVDGGTYNPVLATSGGGIVAQLGAWRWVRARDTVHVIGLLEFTPAAPGVTETIRWSLPLTPNPDPFAAANDLTGVGYAENQGNTVCVATVGAATGELDETTAALVRIAVAFSFLAA